MSAALLMLAAGCGSPTVQVSDVPTPDGEDATACRSLSGDLPQTIGDKLAKRTVEPSSPYLAAWGTPAVVLRCGVGIPATYRPGDDLTVVNNVGWFEDDRQNDVVYTTITRAPRIALAVPRKRKSSFEILVDLSGSIIRHTTGPDLTAQ
jgi:hypothetical protein